MDLQRRPVSGSRPDGYIPVAVEQDPGIAPRGPIDSELASEHLSGMVAAGVSGEQWLARSMPLAACSTRIV